MLDPLHALPEGHVVPHSVITASPQSRAHYLAAAKDAGAPVRCLCREGGVPLGVALRTRPRPLYYLYPLHRGDPAQHALGCPHCDADPREANPGPLSGAPSVERMDEGVSINASLPLTIARASDRQGAARGQADGEQEGIEMVASEQPDASGPDTGSTAPNLDSVLRVLWARAQLTRWRPRWQGRRHYAVVRARLVAAADGVFIRRRNRISDRLYVPPVWREPAGAEIDKALAEWVERLIAGDGCRSWRGFVLGVARGVEAQGERWRVRLAQTRLALEVGPRRGHLLRGVLASCATSPRRQVVVLALVSPPTLPGRSAGVARALGADQLAWLPVTAAWLPARDVFAARLVNALVAQQRAFYCPLPVRGVTNDKAIPEVVLDDDPGRGLPINRSVVGRSADDGRPEAAWCWSVAVQPAPPALPPARKPLLNRSKVG